MLAWLKIKLIKYIVRPTLLGLVVLTLGGILVFYLDVLLELRSVVSKQEDKLVSNLAMSKEQLLELRSLMLEKANELVSSLAMSEEPKPDPYLTHEELHDELKKFETKINEWIQEHSLNPEKQVNKQVDDQQVQ